MILAKPQAAEQSKGVVIDHHSCFSGKKGPRLAQLGKKKEKAGPNWPQEMVFKKKNMLFKLDSVAYLEEEDKKLQSRNRMDPETEFNGSKIKMP